jgi:hypothetical protein
MKTEFLFKLPSVLKLQARHRKKKKRAGGKKKKVRESQTTKLGEESRCALEWTGEMN